MEEKNKSEFNLIDEPWIIVRTGEVQETVSLKTVLTNAHNYTSLAGEMPTQDLAILRLLLAVLHSALHNDEKEVRRWSKLWKEQRFPEDVICDYLEKHRAGFWLFDEKYPFYQVADIEKCTVMAAAKLNGALSESGNKSRLFPVISGDEKESLSYAEAARWIVCYNSWDDSSVKCSVSEKGSVGWLGSLGNIYAIGDNLFETLMLNLVFDSPDTEQLPVWERELSCNTTEGKIYGTATPDNQAELLTLLGRYMLLVKSEDGKTVEKVKVSKKNLVSQTNLHEVEKMTLWSQNKKSEYYPKKHNTSVQVWREFASIVPESADGDYKPGIREWISKFTGNNQPLHDKIISFGICGVEYDSKCCSVTNSFGDLLTIHASLLSELGKEWNYKIVDEIAECDNVATLVERLKKELILSTSAVPDKLDHINEQAGVVKQRFYSMIDLPTRKWIESIDPQKDDMYEKCGELRNTVADIARKYAVELSENMGNAAIIGRQGKDIYSKSKDAKRHYSSPEALNYFYGRINKYLKGGAVYGK